MKVTLPLSYMVGFRSNRGAKSPPAPVHLWKNTEFDIASYNAIDTHFVAEWRQVYGKSPLEPGPERVGNWRADLANDPNLARLVMIDGQFYLPVRGLGHGGFGTGLRGLFADTLAEDIYRTEKKFALGGQALSGFGYHRLRQSDWTPNSVGNEGSLDLRGKSIDFDEYEVKRRQTSATFSTMAFVDGVLFKKVPEPVIVISVSVENDVETATMKIGQRVDYAWPTRELYFPLTHLEQAQRHMADYWPESVSVAKFSDMSVFIQEVLSTNLETAEAERGVSHFVEKTGDLLRFLGRDVANLWFDLRDALRAQPDGLDADVLDAMSDKIVTFVEHVEQVDDVPDDNKEILRFGRMCAERWQLRVIEDGQKLVI